MKHLGKLTAAISLLVVLGFFWVLWTLIHTTVADGMKEVLLVMVGALASKFGDVVTFTLKARTDELLASMNAPESPDSSPKPAGGLDDAAISALIADRASAMKAGDTGRAETIRQRLLARGVVLTDTPQGTDWHRA